MIKDSNSFNEAHLYDKKVVLSVITLAAKEITGVDSLHSKGVKASFLGNNIDVEVFINIIYGYTVSDVAYRVQENIKRGVETMTTYKINAVNVNIMGISFGDQIL